MYCKTCLFHVEDGFCNSEKVQEVSHPPYHTLESEKEIGSWFAQSDKVIMLMSGGGGMWTGDNFGCVHHEED